MKQNGYLLSKLIDCWSTHIDFVCFSLPALLVEDNADTNAIQFDNDDDGKHWWHTLPSLTIVHVVFGFARFAFHMYHT